MNIVAGIVERNTQERPPKNFLVDYSPGYLRPTHVDVRPRRRRIGRTLTATASPTSWAVTLPEATGTTGRAADAASANWAFSLPEATGTRTGRTFGVAASPANWAFSLPEAASTRIGRTLTVAAAPAIWRFELPEVVPNRIGRNLRVDASPADWAFRLPEAASTRTGRTLTAAAAPARWLFDLPEAIPDRTGRTLTVAAGPASWVFILPEANPTRTGRTLTVTAAPANWLFDLPETSPTRTGRTLTVDAGPAQWTFELPDAAGTNSLASTTFAVDASAAQWAFALPTVTPTNVSSFPHEPRFLSVHTPGGTVVDLVWSLPLNTGNSPIVRYEVAVTDPAGVQGDFEPTGTALTWRVRGLARGHRYGFAVRAVNSGGVSPATAIVYGTPLHAALTGFSGCPFEVAARATRVLGRISVEKSRLRRINPSRNKRCEP